MHDSMTGRWLHQLRPVYLQKQARQESRKTGRQRLEEVYTIIQVIKEIRVNGRPLLSSGADYATKNKSSLTIFLGWKKTHNSESTSNMQISTFALFSPHYIILLSDLSYARYSIKEFSSSAVLCNKSYVNRKLSCFMRNTLQIVLRGMYSQYRLPAQRDLLHGNLEDITLIA